MAYIKKTLSAKERKAAQQKAEEDERQLRKFVEHSVKISGDAVDWGSDDVKRHFDLALNLFNGHQYTSVALINSTLTNTRNDWYRTGTDASSKGLMPDAEFVEILIDELDWWIEDGLIKLRKASKRDQAAFALQAHHRVFCVHPFKQKNSRTARLVHLEVRSLFKLPLQIITYEESKKYLAEALRFRNKKFLPNLKRYIAHARRRQNAYREVAWRREAKREWKKRNAAR